MLRWSLRPSFFVLLVVVLAACGGAGGCSGCAGCGITPLPAGFPQASVIPSSASVRVTRPGLDFLAANLGPIAGDALGKSGGVVTFNIPPSNSSFSIGTAYVCQMPSQGPPPQCVVDVNVAGSKLNLDALGPADGPNMEPALTIHGTVPVKADDIPVDVKGPFGIDLGTIEVGLGQGGCNGGTPAVDYAPVPVTATLPIVDETISPRDGYTKVDSQNAAINATIDPNDVQLCGGLLASIAGAFKSYLVGQLTGPLQNTLKNQLQSQLCTKVDTMTTPQCPDGTEADGGDCVFQSQPSTCVPTMLGMDGHLDVGKLLAKLAAGSTAGADLVLASAGAAQPTVIGPSTSCPPGDAWTQAGGCQTDPSPPYSGHTPNGLTLGMLGGMLPNPTSSCVPQAPNALPMNIPIPDQLLTDGVTPWPAGDPGPDLDLALAGRYLSYAGTSLYNGGALCLGVTTASFQALSTGYVSAIVPSIKDLTFEPGRTSKPAALAITTRPQKPPVITIGDGTDIKKDPLLSILLPQLAIDFYVWSEDRYIRAFTFTSDITIPVDLETGKDPVTNPNGGILPQLGDLTLANATVTNSNLLWENPSSLASSLSALLGGVVGQFLGKGFSPINLNGSLSKYGIALNIPADGFRKLTKGTDTYVGLFADLTTATMGMVETRASIDHIEVHPEAMTLEGADRARFPKLDVTLDSPQDDGSGNVEYSTWIDQQPHSAWTKARSVVVDDSYLFLQGKHVLYAAARYAGQAQTQDETPAEVPFLIDVLPPVVRLDTAGGATTVYAYDYVSDDSALQARWRLTGADGAAGAWSAWKPLTTLGAIPGGSAQSLEVQVQDEAGNVADTNGLIRGRPDPTLGAGSSCACQTPGAAGGAGPGLAAVGAVLGLLGLFGARRGRARAGGRGGERRAPPDRLAGRLGRAPTTGACGAALLLLMATSQGCACGGGGNAGAEGDAGDGGGLMACGPGCNQPCGPALGQGLIGEYTSVAVASDGTVWVAGYDDADVTGGVLYGDLVAGKYDTGKQKVQWADVDGLPPLPGDGDCAPNDPTGWRQGLTDPGPDVGLWTSLQLDANGNPMISYYDATNAALKFARSPDGGKTWQSHTVMQAASSDIGRYSKMLVVDGKPVVAFLVVEPGTGGWTKSRVVLATGNVATPASAGDWTFQDVLVDPQTPCRAQFCQSGQVCVSTSMQCQSTVSGCKPSDCGASEAGIGSTPQSCVTTDGGPSCQAVMPSTYVDTYPDATGDYVAMASGSQGIGLVVYDRTRGNLVGVAQQGGKWSAQILDGQLGASNDPMRTDTGDVGIGASLAIDTSGNWHVSYANGWTEALQYLEVPSGNLAKPLAPEVVDDGLHLNGQVNPDGQHIMGDDSSVSVDSSGAIRIVYMDATAGTLHEAIGAPAAGNKHTWTVKAIPQNDVFAGFFPHYVSQPQLIANWVRSTDHSQSPPVVTGDVAFVAP